MFKCALNRGNETVIKLPISRNDVDVNVKANGRASISWAAENEREAVVKQLLEAKAEIESNDGDGWTWLLQAASNRHEEVVKLLLEAEAEADLKVRDGRSG